jgi:hypothetical protein
MKRTLTKHSSFLKTPTNTLTTHANVNVNSNSNAYNNIYTPCSISAITSNSPSSTSASFTSAQSHRTFATQSPSSLEKASKRWKPLEENPNVIKDKNLALTFGLLRMARQQVAEQATHSNSKTSKHVNITVDPLSIAQSIQNSNTSYRSFLNKLYKSTPEILLPEFKSQLDEELCYNVDRLREVIAMSGSEMAQYMNGSGSSSFRGYLAPRFAKAKTKAPAWFIPSAVEGKTEEQLRVSADMILRSEKNWYGETETHQIIDLEYLSDQFLMTIISPRPVDEPTILHHPHRGYILATRRKSNVDDVLQSYTVNQFLHECQHRFRMRGLLALPTFDSSYTFKTEEVCHRASFQISSHGLSEGGTNVKTYREHHDMTEFALSAHRPFIWMVRHRPTNAVLLAGTVEKVNIKPFKMKYPAANVAWIEDKEAKPIKNFSREAGNLNALE